MYIIVWEFKAKAGCEAAFEQAYGPQGAWVNLFEKGEGFLGTELLQDTAEPGWYITIDRWATQAAFEEFRRRWAGDYEAVDARCAAWTENETALGSFATVDPG